MAGWLFLDPYAPWAAIAAATAGRHPTLYTDSLLGAVELLQEDGDDEVPGLPAGAQLLALPFPQLPAALQLWTVCHLALALCRRFDPGFRGQLGHDPRELVGASTRAAVAALAWCQRWKQHGRALPAPAPAPAAGNGGGSSSSEAQERAE